MKIEYDSNNSGGNWWLEDKDWEALEAAGWEVEWGGLGSSFSKEKPKKGDRWLGALACTASKNFETPGDAMREFEKITGQDVSNGGCNCCGAPHRFRWGRAVDESLPKEAEYGSVSGEGCLEYLFPNRKVPASLREAMEPQ